MEIDYTIRLPNFIGPKDITPFFGALSKQFLGSGNDKEVILATHEEVVKHLPKTNDVDEFRWMGFVHHVNDAYNNVLTKLKQMNVRFGIVHHVTHKWLDEKFSHAYQHNAFQITNLRLYPTMDFTDTPGVNLSGTEWSLIPNCDGTSPDWFNMTEQIIGELPSGISKQQEQQVKFLTPRLWNINQVLHAGCTDPYDGIYMPFAIVQATCPGIWEANKKPNDRRSTPHYFVMKRNWDSTVSVHQSETPQEAILNAAKLGCDVSLLA